MAKNRALLTVFFAAALSAGAVQAAPVGQRIDLSYNLYTAGLPVAELDTKLEMTGAAYRVASDLRTVGLADMRVGWRAAQESLGRMIDGHARPSRYASNGTWRDEPRRTEINYSPAGTIDLALVPDAEVDEHPPVSADQRAGTVDFMSAMVQLAFAKSASAACGGTRAVFDGRRRYDMVLTPDREDVLKKVGHAAYAGPALRCRVELRRVAGFAPDADGFELPEKVFVWLAREGGSGLILPVKIQAPTEFGTATIFLARVASEDFRQAGLAD